MNRGENRRLESTIYMWEVIGDAQLHLVEIDWHRAASVRFIFLYSSRLKF
jgi:hypothetical protein